MHNDDPRGSEWGEETITTAIGPMAQRTEGSAVPYEHDVSGTWVWVIRYDGDLAMFAVVEAAGRPFVVRFGGEYDGLPDEQIVNEALTAYQRRPFQSAPARGKGRGFGGPS